MLLTADCTHSAYLQQGHACSLQDQQARSRCRAGMIASFSAKIRTLQGVLAAAAITCCVQEQQARCCAQQGSGGCQATGCMIHASLGYLGVANTRPWRETTQAMEDNTDCPQAPLSFRSMTQPLVTVCAVQCWNETYEPRCKVQTAALSHEGSSGRVAPSLSRRFLRAIWSPFPDLAPEVGLVDAAAPCPVTDSTAFLGKNMNGMFPDVQLLFCHLASAMSEQRTTLPFLERTCIWLHLLKLSRASAMSSSKLALSS
jgi:hypothetical protein